MSDASSFDDVSRLLGGRMINSDPGRRTVSVATDGTAVDVRAAARRGRSARDQGELALPCTSATLDDVFLALTGRPADHSDKEPAHV